MHACADACVHAQYAIRHASCGCLAACMSTSCAIRHVARLPCTVHHAMRLLTCAILHAPRRASAILDAPRADRHAPSDMRHIACATSRVCLTRCIMRLLTRAF
eukprot:364046-Chlamydomonas_euryale.AAC.9